MTIGVKNLSIRTDAKKILLQNIHTKFSSEEFLVLLGNNGAGKSLLLRCILGLQEIDAGAIEFFHQNKEPITFESARSELGLVLQDSEKQILCNIVREDLLFGLEMHGVSHNERENRIHEVCELLPISHLLNRNVLSLSGGERRLISIATVIVCKPRIIFLDEPFQSLDYPTALALLQALIALHQKKVGIVLVTHNYHAVLAHATKVLILEAGVVIFEGSPVTGIAQFAQLGLESPRSSLDHMTLQPMSPGTRLQPPS